MMMLEPPMKIYLQFHGDGDPDCDGPVDDEDVTWSTDQQFNQDIEYICYPWVSRMQRIEEAAKALIKCKGRFHSEQNMKALIDAVNAPCF